MPRVERASWFPPSVHPINFNASSGSGHCLLYILLPQEWNGGRSQARVWTLLPLLVLCQLLQAGQGKPARDVPQILAQLAEQVAAVSSASDLLALLSTMEFLAEVVENDRLELNRESLEVRPQGPGRGTGARRASSLSIFIPWPTGVVRHRQCRRPSVYSGPFFSGRSLLCICKAPGLSQHLSGPEHLRYVLHNNKREAKGQSYHTCRVRCLFYMQPTWV